MFHLSLFFIIKSEGIPYLLYDLVKGNLYEFRVNINNEQFSDMHLISLGTKAINITTFCPKNKMHAFTSSDLLTIIYCRRYILAYVHVHFIGANHVLFRYNFFFF